MEYLAQKALRVARERLEQRKEDPELGTKACLWSKATPAFWLFK
jgi:hypothetical protein